eukprot:CAMPEP_0172360838 /NCGR_PEP_ID=MMETSP1060-20121228/4786_1 /TAXON_ID=37318 /ORGANISM="Pseudo-nitzschia pungens, Strain cf. cingulata" /LENGTH=342 /DNA_ID=CAMNT_0013082927 /DNA_START=363 /DNA_END=1391 /DNA_ORIENTATION=-
MATRAIPSFQTKSKRNIFLEDEDEGGHAEEESKHQAIDNSEASEEERKSTNDDKSKLTIVVEEVDIKQSSSKENNGQEMKVVSNGSFSPLKKRSPKKSCSPKDTRSGGTSSNFFTRLFGNFSGNKRRPPMKAKGVYYDSSTCDVSKESDRTLVIGENGEAEYIPDWIASNHEDHQRNVPVVVRRPEHDVFNEADDKKLLKKIIMKAKQLPQEPGKYASNHIMVNAERTTRIVPPLRRERHMDRIARDHAKLMAEDRDLFQIETPRDLRRLLKEIDVDSNELPDFTRLGMNIGRGKTIAEVHRFMMAALAERNNIRDKRFSHMGMGTHQDKNGYLYMCQIFGG